MILGGQAESLDGSPVGISPTRYESPLVKLRALSEDIEFITPAANMGSRPEPLDNSSSSQVRKGLYGRAFSPLTAGGIRQSVFTLVQTALGGGVLALSYVLRLSGAGFGAALLLASGVIAFVSMQILMRGAVILETFTISGLLAACLGPKSGMLLDLSLCLYGNGAIITYFIFLGDFVPSIVMDVNGGLPSWCSSEDNLRTCCLLAALCIAVPFVFPKELSALRFISPVALVAILYTAMVVVVKFLSLPAQSCSDIHLVHFDWSNFKSFSICVFAYNCHINVVPVAKEMLKRTDARIAKTTFRVASVQLGLYLMIAIGGYLSFCSQTPQNLITAYPDDDHFILASRVLLSITTLACIPVNVNPTVRSIFCLLELACPALREQPPPLLNGINYSIPSEHDVTAAVRPWPCNRDGVRHLLSIACLIVEFCGAMVFSEVATMMSFLGATVGTLMMMVIPVLLVQVGCPDMYPGRFSRWGVTLFLSAAAACSVASLFIS